MKSKSFDSKQSPIDKDKHNKTFDFVSLYKPAAEKSNLSKNNEDGDGIDKENNFLKSQKETPRRGLSPNKKKKKGKQELLDISKINIEGPMLEANLSKNSPLNQSKMTSTPRSSDKDKNQVKSIMKNCSAVNEDTMHSSQVQYDSKPKKRNKSVSFMLDDNEEVSPKKTKSEESLVATKKTPDKTKPIKPGKVDIMHQKKLIKGKKQHIEKGNSGDISMETDPAKNGEKKENLAMSGDVHGPSSSESTKLDKKKKLKHIKKHKKTEATTSESNNNEEAVDNKNKKLSKKKRKGKSPQPTDAEVDEPAAKTRKKEVKPEVIAENLENLTIGDNPHTLTSLLDEMTVADKDKRKKHKRKLKKAKGPIAKPEKTVDTDGAKEKVKWTKKWNKAKKGNVGNNIALFVIVENLPLSLICSYKKVLAEQFEKCGSIKRIGVAEVYPNEGKGFTTTIYFDSEDAATEALTQNGTIIDGNKIQVKRPLPPTQTTIVVRSYALLSDQSICTTFSQHGRIRSIRRRVKGKKAMETVFIEFDGPEAVEKAIKLSKGAKVAGKKIYVAKFEARKKKAKVPEGEAASGPGQSDGDADSEDSND